MKTWPFIPQREFTEALEWYTDILQSKAGEQRVALRSLPRQSLDFSLLLEQGQLSKAQALVAEVGVGELYVPLWGYVERLGALSSGQVSLPADTNSAEYVAGGRAVVWQSDSLFEEVELTGAAGGVLTLASPTTFTYSDAYLCPLRTFRFSQALDVARGASDYARVRVAFASTDTHALPTALPAFESYLGHDVLTDRPVILGDVRDRLARDAELIDAGTGRVAAYSVLNYMTSDTVMGWSTLDRAELWRLRCWLYSRRGRQVGFWMPTWNRDLELTRDVEPTSTTITIRSIGFSSAYSVRDIMVRSTSGDRHFLRVIGGSAGLSGTEVLQLSGPAGFTLSAAQVELVSFMDFARLDADRVEIRHKAARGATVLAPITRIPPP